MGTPWGVLILARFGSAGEVMAATSTPATRAGCVMRLLFIDRVSFCLLFVLRSKKSP